MRDVDGTISLCSLARVERLIGLDLPALPSGVFALPNCLTIVLRVVIGRVP